MTAKILYRFDGQVEQAESLLGRLKAEYKPEALASYVNNGDLFVEIDLPASFEKIYSLARRLKKSLSEGAGREPSIMRIQAFN